jgi:HEAT repeat protein
MLRALLIAFTIAMHHDFATVRAADKKSEGPSVEEQAAKLREDFKSTDPAVRRSAVSSMPHSPAASLLMPELFAALKDSDGEIREWAATVIGNQGEKSVGAVPQLIVQLESDPVKTTRETAARALGRIGKTVPTNRAMVAPLEKAARDDADSVTRVVALGALLLMDPDNVRRRDAVRAFLKHDDPLTRMKAAHALGYLSEKAKIAAPEIARALQQATDPKQRAYLGRALGQVGDREQLPILLAELERETDPTAQSEMRGAVKRLGGTLPAKK